MAFQDTITTPISSVTANAANQRPDIDGILKLLKPYQTPIMQWLYFSEGKSDVVINQNGNFSWFEDEFVPHNAQQNGAITGGSPTETITIQSANWIAVGDMLLIEATDELVYVSAVNSSTSIDITTLDGGNITPVAATDGLLKKVGSRNNEFATARAAVSTVEIQVQNYLTIHSETVTTTGRYEAGDMYTNGKSHDEQVQKKIEEMKFEVERNVLLSPTFGTVTDTSAAGSFRFTWGKGINAFITTNRSPYTKGSLTEAQLRTFFKTVFQKGTNLKKFFCGSDLLDEINAIILDKPGFRVENLVTEYGIELMRWRTPFGKVDIIWDPVLDGKYTSYGMLLDDEKVKMRYMADDKNGSRKFQMLENVETPGTDGTSTKLLMDVGIQVDNEETCGVLFPS